MLKMKSFQKTYLVKFTIEKVFKNKAIKIFRANTN